MPPQISGNVVVNHTFRYITTDNTFAQTFSNNRILLALGSYATSSTAIRCLAKSFRVHSFEIWATNPSGSASSISLAWATTLPGAEAFLRSNKEVNDASMSSAYPSHIFARPPPGSFQDSWCGDQASAQFCNLRTNGSAIIDMNVSYILLDGDVSGLFTSAVTGTVVGATVNTIYYPRLSDELQTQALNDIAVA